jgi:cation:H+ antiporter
VWSAERFVEGSASTARHFGMPPLLIGMVIVGFGTSAPEMVVSALAAWQLWDGAITRLDTLVLFAVFGGLMAWTIWQGLQKKTDALGNVLGSNLFDTLAVVGIAGAIHPMAVGAEALNRDMLVMAALIQSLFVIGYGFRGPGRINRTEGTMLLACYVGYTACLISRIFG